MEELSLEGCVHNIGWSHVSPFPHQQPGRRSPADGAVVAVPLMASVGVAVDYSRINGLIQVALDATVLMDVKKCGDGNDAQRQTEATNTFNSLFSRPEVTDITISPNFTSAGGSKLTLNGTAVVHTNFLGIIGVSVSGPLVHEPIIDQRASTEVLRQHQGRRHYALHGAGQHRRRPCLDATAELRQRRREVFPPYDRRADCHDLRSDRHVALQVAPGDVMPLPRRCGWLLKGRPRRDLPADFRDRTNRVSTTAQNNVRHLRDLVQTAFTHQAVEKSRTKSNRHLRQQLDPQ
jgi:hypothetical protein